MPPTNNLNQKGKEMRCPYCNSIAILRDSSIIYHGRSYGNAWVCSRYPECDSYVGCHKGTDKPLGRIANAELREWKIKAHNAIDELWKSGKYTRGKVYQIVGDILGKPINEAHIGMFSVEDCRDLVVSVKHLNEYIKNEKSI